MQPCRVLCQTESRVTVTRRQRHPCGRARPGAWPVVTHTVTAPPWRPCLSQPPIFPIPTTVAYRYNHVGFAFAGSASWSTTKKLRLRPWPRRKATSQPVTKRATRSRSRDLHMSESGPAADGGAGGEPADASGVRSMVQRWKMDGAPARARLLLRALAWLFSLLALVVMASNQHGGSQDFREYPEYKSVLYSRLTKLTSITHSRSIDHWNRCSAEFPSVQLLPGHLDRGVAVRHGAGPARRPPPRLRAGPHRGEEGVGRRRLRRRPGGGFIRCACVCAAPWNDPIRSTHRSPTADYYSVCLAFFFL